MTQPTASTSPSTLEATQDVLSLLMVSPFGPVGRGGLHTWTETTVGCISTRPDVKVSQVNTSVGWRGQNDLRPLRRYVGGAAQALRDIARTAQVMKQEQIDVMHLNTSAGPNILRDIILLKLARKNGIGSVIHYHFGYMPELKKANGRYWQMLLKAGRIVDVSLLMDSGSLKALSESLPDRDVRNYPNPIGVADLDEYAKEPLRSAPHDLIEITCVGHVIPRKGVEELTLACEHLADLGLYLKLVGPVLDDYRAKLESMAPTLTKAGRITFTGGADRRTAMRHLVGSDIFCMPSYSEGFPSVILEAMALRRPIITSAVAAMPDMLDMGRPNECGILVQPKDVPGLEEAIRLAVSKPELLTTMVDRARHKVVEQYDAPVVSRLMVDLWKEVKKRHRS